VTEDEAFIRAIVDRPGEDTVRLVYADWLDDHDDPRGPYLRAEHEWVATHDPSERETLRQLAKSLDPVWVALVSRPPVGVCCDQLGIAKSSIRLHPRDIDQLEQRLKLAIPVEYRAFLLNYNGGRSKSNSFPHPILADWNCELQPWLSLKPAEEPPKPGNVLWSIPYYRSSRQSSYHTLIQLCAADPGHYEAFAIGYGQRNNGRVHYVLDFNLNEFPGRPRKVADSLGMFLASIGERVEPSVTDLDDNLDS